MEYKCAINQLKARLTSETVISYFDPTKPTELSVDISPVRLGQNRTYCTKTTNGDGETEVHIAANASRALIDL